MENQMSEDDKRTLQFLADSLVSGNLGLVKTKRRSDGTTATLIVACVSSDNTPEGRVSLAPIAVLVDSSKINEEYLTPGELDDLKEKEEKKKDIFQLFLDIINRLKK